jgi:hypothetical protein
MKRLIVLMALMLATTSSVFARDGLESFLGGVNVRAQADMPRFYATVSAQFGVPEAKVRTIHQTVSEPAVVFMIFQLGQFSGKPVDRVVQVYQHGRGVGKGWGMLAKELGIKPGSAEFHALKRGDLVYGENGGPVRANGQGKGHGQGHGKHGRN